MAMEEVKKKYTSDEFLAMTNVEGRYELVSGEIYAMAPSPADKHQEISIGISSTIWNYIRASKGKCKVREAPADVMLDDENTVQPDIFVVCDPSKFNDHGCVGAPDWVIEILSASDPAHDTIDKLALYLQSGVKEYWIIDPKTEKVFVYLFEKTNAVGVYTFDDEIPVGIYKNMETPLKLRINDVL